MHELYLLNRRDKRRTEYWHQLVKAWGISGLKQKKFCEQNGLNPDDLQRWAAKLRSNEIKSKLNSPPIDFLPVEVSAPSIATEIKVSCNRIMELHHRSGFYFKISEDFEQGLLQKVIDLLVRLP